MLLDLIAACLMDEIEIEGSGPREAIPGTAGEARSGEGRRELL